MNTREEDLAEADALDAFIKIFGPKNRKIREEMIPRWVAEMKDLRTRGMHEEADRIAQKVERTKGAVKKLDDQLDKAMSDMLRLRNRYRERVR